MVQRTSQPRYYLRDSETNELWCFDTKFFSGKTKIIKKEA